jgi:hypothetical protein
MSALPAPRIDPRVLLRDPTDLSARRAFRLAQARVGAGRWYLVRDLDPADLLAAGLRSAGPARVLGDLTPPEVARLHAVLAHPTRVVPGDPVTAAARHQEDRDARDLLARCPLAGGWLGLIDLDVRDDADPAAGFTASLAAARALDPLLEGQGLRVAWYRTNARGGIHGDVLLPPDAAHLLLGVAALRLLEAAGANAGIPLLRHHPSKETRPLVVLDGRSLGYAGRGGLHRLPGAAKTDGAYPKTPLDLASGATLARHPIIHRSDPGPLLAEARRLETSPAEVRARAPTTVVPAVLEPGRAATEADRTWLRAADPALAARWAETWEAGDRHRREFGLLISLIRLGADDDRAARLLRSKPGGVRVLDGEAKLARAVADARARATLPVPTIVGGGGSTSAAPASLPDDLRARLHHWAADAALGLDAAARIRLRRIADCGRAFLGRRCDDGHDDPVVVPCLCGSPLCLRCDGRRQAPRGAHVEAEFPALVAAWTWTNPVDATTDPAGAVRELLAAHRRLRKARLGKPSRWVRGVCTVLDLRDAQSARYLARLRDEKPHLVAGWTCELVAPARAAELIVATHLEHAATFRRILEANRPDLLVAFLRATGPHFRRSDGSRDVALPWLTEEEARAERKRERPSHCQHEIPGPDGPRACGLPLRPVALARGRVLAVGKLGGPAWPVEAAAFATLAAEAVLLPP